MSVFGYCEVCGHELRAKVKVCGECEVAERVARLADEHAASDLKVVVDGWREKCARIEQERDEALAELAWITRYVTLQTASRSSRDIAKTIERRRFNNALAVQYDAKQAREPNPIPTEAP